MNNATVKEAYKRLFPQQQLAYRVEVKFSGRFSPYNANVRKKGRTLTFSFSREWKSVSKEINIGLVQGLLLRILGEKASATTTTNLELYNSFIKNLHLAAAKTEADGKLLEVFGKVNAKHFHNLMETPNLKWGLASRRRLATYDYHTDTISISNIFKEAEEELIAYLLYHEVLHKKLKFSSGKTRTVHHSSEFRALEKKFPNQEQMEKRLNSFLREKSRIKWLPGFI